VTDSRRPSVTLPVPPISQCKAEGVAELDGVAATVFDDTTAVFDKAATVFDEAGTVFEEAAIVFDEITAVFDKADDDAGVGEEVLETMELDETSSQSRSENTNAPAPAVTRLVKV
jgi:hypothetical protein